MKILIIYTYPNHESLNGNILDSFQQNISSKHAVRILDLYQENFNPVLYFNKEHRRRDLQYSVETKSYREAITWSDHIVYIFPIWWSGMPAILKGFIDRVFAQNFAYSYSTKKITPNKLLKGKTAAIIVTHDTPYLISKIIQNDYGQVLKTQILKNMCGIQVTKFYSLANVRKSSLKKRKKFLRKVGEYAKKL